MCITLIPLITISKFVLSSVKLLPLTNLRALFISWRIFADPLPLFFFVASPGRKQKRKQLSGLPRSDSHIFPLVLQCVHSIPRRPSPARFNSWQGDQTRSSPSGGSADASSVLPLIQHVVLFFFSFFFQVWVVEEQGGGLLLHLKAVGLAAGGFKAVHLFKN